MNYCNDCFSLCNCILFQDEFFFYKFGIKNFLFNFRKICNGKRTGRHVSKTIDSFSKNVSTSVENNESNETRASTAVNSRRSDPADIQSIEDESSSSIINLDISPAVKRQKVQSNATSPAGIKVGCFEFQLVVSLIKI